MASLNRQILLKSLKLFDMIIMLFSFTIATVADYSHVGTISFSQLFAMQTKVQNFALFLGLLLVWHITFSLFRLYHSKRFTKPGPEVIDIIKATSLGTLTIYIASILFRVEMVTPVFLGIFWVCSSVITIVSRLMLRYMLKHIRARGRNLRYMLVVGTNSRAVEFAKKIEKEPERGYKLIGFMDNDWRGISEFQKTGYNIVTDFNTFPAFIKERVVDEVTIFLSLKSYYQQISRIVALCEEQGIVVRYLYSLCEMKMAHSKAEPFEDEPAINLYTGNMNGSQVIVKRALDFILSLALIVSLSPFFLIIALAVKINSPGSTLFVQKRVGFNKRRFEMYKFRTMLPDAEKKQAELEHLNEVSGPVFKIKNDPRITPIGRFLRKTSIDELPQLFNVLKGDMSIVGPRPLPLRDYKGFDHDWHRRRLSVHPGITCLWQISGRSNMPFERWMELDMQYIDNWSLGLDLKIIVKTIPAVIRGSGAA